MSIVRDGLFLYGELYDQIWFRKNPHCFSFYHQCESGKIFTNGHIDDTEKKGVTRCNRCRKEFPSRKKLDWMAKLVIMKAGV